MSTRSTASKKLSQLELRKYMQQHKSKGKVETASKKVESPLAKYNDQGQLTCVLCNSIVRSEAVWTIHVNAKQHKQNIESAKKLKERTNNFTTSLKRPLTPPHEVPTKKLKSILKNGTKTDISSCETEIKEKSELPSDFFDVSSEKKTKIDVKLMESKDEDEKVEPEPSAKDVTETLPEGFFDDPKLDAKARHQEYKDPIQEEWEKFQKEIRDAEGESLAIIAEDQEESTTERQIDEIDEQMKNLSKVLVLEKKKVEVISVIHDSKITDMEEDEPDDEDFDEFLDWRCKTSLR